MFAPGRIALAAAGLLIILIWTAATFEADLGHKVDVEYNAQSVEAACEEIDTFDNVTSNSNLPKEHVEQLVFFGLPGWDNGWWDSLKAFTQVFISLKKYDIVLQNGRRLEKEGKISYKTMGASVFPHETKLTSWEDASNIGSEQNDLFQKEVKDFLKTIHPEVKKIELKGFKVRGEGFKAYAGFVPHGDLYHDMSEISRFQEEQADWLQTKSSLYPGLLHSPNQHNEAAAAEGLELGCVLGVWKPRNERNPILDYPLVVADPWSVPMDLRLPLYTRMIFESYPVATVGWTMKYDENVRWYHWPNMTKHEILVFRHFTTDQPQFSHIHQAATLPDPLPEGAESRASIETRAYLYFDKGSSCD